MRSGGLRSPLARTLLVTAVLLGVAIILWILATVISWESECPPGGGYQPAGLDKGISLWPPGAECPPGRIIEGEGYGGNDIVAYEALPWLKWAILGLSISAMATLIAGLGASINSPRSRPETGRS
ncbi:MAG: hypothetical protein ACRDL3_05215 [Solirubrobacterales bacterium]